jgi:hypothetical protein
MAFDYDTSTPGIQPMPLGMFRDASGAIDMGEDVYAPRRNRRVDSSQRNTLGQIWGAGARAGVDVSNLWRSWENTGFKDYGLLARDWMFSTQWDDAAAAIDAMASARRQGYRDEDILEMMKAGQAGQRIDFSKYRTYEKERPELVFRSANTSGGGGFLDAYNTEKADLAEKKSIRSLFKDMIEY